MIICMFLLAAAVYDWKCRMIPGWLYGAAALEAFLWRVSCAIGGGSEPWKLFLHGNTAYLSAKSLIGGMAVGLFLLVISKVSQGAVGAGDGLLFVITGLYIGFWKNAALLCISLMLCSLWGVGIMILGKKKWIELKKKELPFLPFVLPAGVWIMVI